MPVRLQDEIVYIYPVYKQLLNPSHKSTSASCCITVRYKVLQFHRKFVQQVKRKLRQTSRKHSWVFILFFTIAEISGKSLLHAALASI